MKKALPLHPHPRFKLWYAIPAVAFCLGLGYLVAHILAAGPAAMYLPANSTVTGNAAVVTNASALGGRMVQFGITPVPTPAPTPTPTPASGGAQTLNCLPVPHLCGFPDATNTGIPAGHTLTKVTGDYTITQPGYYHDLDIDGALNIKADHVTVSFVRVHGNGGDGVTMYNAYDTLTDAEVGGGPDGHSFTLGSAIYSGGDQNTNLIQRVNIHHADDGLRLDGGTTVRDTYIHDLSNGLNGAHNDNSQSCAGTHFSFIHNTFLGGNNDPIFLQGGDCGSNDNFFLDYVLVNNNLLGCLHEPNNISGYGISVGRGRNVTITNNHFDRGWEAATIGIYLPNTMVQDQVTLTKTTAANWPQLGNVYDDNGAAVAFPGN